MAGRITIFLLFFLSVGLWDVGIQAAANKPKAKKEEPKSITTSNYPQDIITPERKAKALVADPDLHWNMSSGVFSNRTLSPIITASPLYDTAGNTYYDYQTNDRLPRQIRLSPLGHIHTAWMKSPDVGLTMRAIHYSSWFNATLPRAATETQVSDNAGRGGYNGIVVTPDGNAVPFYHRATAAPPVPAGIFMSYEATPTDGDFIGEIKVPDSVAAMTIRGFWPDGDANKHGDTNMVHLVWVEGHTAGTALRHFGYTRAREGSPGSFSFSTANVFDSAIIYISPIVVASKQSSKVAIIWTHPRKGITGDATDGFDVDLYYIESQVGGADWVNGFYNDAGDSAINITNYVDGDVVRAGGDLTAAYDKNDNLIVTFYSPLFFAGAGVATEGFVNFWSAAKGVRKVFDATFVIPGTKLTVGSFNADKPMIGYHDGTGDTTGKGDYYVMFTSFDPTLADTAANGILNGDIYVSASTNEGFTWSKPVNITNSQKSGCLKDSCDSDMWASMAEKIPDTLHILYVNDKWADRGIDNPSTDATLNPVLYLKQPAFTVGKDTLASVSPSDFTDYCILQGNTKDTTIFIENIGNQDLEVSNILSGQPFASVTVLPPYGPSTNFTIPEGGVRAEVVLSLNAGALACSAYAVTWTVTTNAENSNKGNPNGTFTIDAEFVVYTASSPFYTRKTQVIQCGGVLLSISNTGNVGNANDTAGMYIIADTTNFLFEGSEIFATVMTNNDSVGAHDFHGGAQYHPLYNPTSLSDIEVKDTVFTDSVTFATALSQGRPPKAGTWRVARVYYAVYLPSLDTLCPWPGPWFGYWICEQWWWKVSPAPKFKWVIWYKKKIKQGPPCWWPKWTGQPKIKTFIYDGLVCDWDVPSDSAVVNDGAYNDTFKMAYCVGRGTPYDKYYGATVFMADTNLHLKDSTVYSANGLFAAHVLSNQDLFNYSSYDNWLHKWTSKPGAQHQFAPYEDIHTITTSVCFDTIVGQVSYAQGLAVTIKGLDTLKATVNEMRRCMALDTLVLTPPCLYKAGDANKSNSLNLSDIILLVNHVFKGAAAPDPKCLGDCNNTNTINLSDIIILVNHVFKGAPKPAKDLDGPCCKD